MSLRVLMRPRLNPVISAVIGTCLCQTCGNWASGSSAALARWQSCSLTLVAADSPWGCVDSVQAHWSATGCPPTQPTCSRGRPVLIARSQPHLSFYFHFASPLPLLLRGAKPDSGSSRFCSVWKTGILVVSSVFYNIIG